MSQVIVKRKQNNDELMHAGHKYIKKKMVNGKWRYYYDIKDAVGYDERAARDAAGNKYDQANKNLEKFREHYTSETNKIGRGRLMKDGSGYRPMTKDEEKRITELNKQHAKYMKKESDASKAYGEANRAYKKTVLGKIENAKNTADYVKDETKRLSKKTIKQAKKQINKGKNKVKKLLNIH